MNGMSHPHNGLHSGYQQSQAPLGSWIDLGLNMRSPGSASSNNTYLMPTSPSKRSRTSRDSYKPKISRTIGQRPACLVNASVSYCGNNQIYAFGGFDQYTDEGEYLNSDILSLQEMNLTPSVVYNHVLKLDLGNLQWTLVDNYGDIPGVRMGKCLDLYRCAQSANYGLRSHGLSLAGF